MVLKTINNYLFHQNPILRIALGLCPTLAVTTSVINGLGMGLATTFVLFFSNLLVSSIRKITPDKIRIPVFIIVIATFTTIVDLFTHAFIPALHKSLGIFIPLIVVNCIIFGRAEAFASKNPLIPSLFDALGMGLSFTATLILISFIREYLGKSMLVMILPPGAFLVLGLLIFFLNLFESRKQCT
jgi:electron transport complex protein RnfE